MFGVKLLWCVFLFCVVNSLKIINIDVPSLIVLDSQNSKTQILNCSYDLEADNSPLVVKWYKDDQVIYQWIRGREPTAFEPFKNLVDTSYEASLDRNKKYSDLALINLTINSTGTYKCVVQATKISSMDQKHMQVIDVSHHELNIQRKNDTYIECTVMNVYPKPSIKVIYDNSNENIDEILTTSTAVVESENGFFNGTATGSINDNSNYIEGYSCVVNFMDFDFNLTKHAISSSDRTFFSKLILIFVFFYV